MINKEELTLLIALISTILFYVCMELMFRYMPNASFLNTFVFTEITTFEGTLLLISTILSLFFSVGSWIELTRKK